ncbi:MAG: AMP-binding protein [Myxococcales bacterium]|nr:AMP-binding protein [Myxococcales bacterium]
MCLPPELTNIASLSDLNLARFGERPALIVGERTFTNLQMHQTARRLASALLELKLDADDRVGVYLDNRVELLWVYQALSSVGATIVPLMSSLRPDEVHVRLSHCRASMLITTAALDAALDVGALESVARTLYAEQLEQLAEKHAPLDEVRPRALSDLAFILYTGATSSAAKGVMQTHGNLLANVRNNTPLNVAHVDLMVLPMAHTFGVGVWLGNYMFDGCAVLMPGGFEPERALRLIERHRVDRMVAVPSMLVAMLEHPAADRIDVSSMKIWGIGGAPFDEAQAARFAARFPGEVQRGYGLTEACPTIARQVEGQSYKPGSNGRVVPGVVVRICDPSSGAEVTPGEVGEICARGDNISPGYLDMPEETARVFGDGWLHTGDLGRIDADGELFVVGRVKDLIIQGGLNVYPAEVELCLARQSGVAQAAVVGRPDELVGEVVVAFVTAVAGAPLDEAALRTGCATQLAPYKVPEAIFVVDELPLTDLGKIDKRALRDDAVRRGELAAVSAARTDDAADTRLERLCAAFAEALECERVEPDDNFFELGGTSLQSTRLLGLVRAQFDPSLQLRTFFEAPSPVELLEHLAGASAAASGEQPALQTAGDDVRFAHSGLDESQVEQLARQLGTLDGVVRVQRLTVGQLDAVPHLVDAHHRVTDEALRDSLMRMHMTISGELDLDAWREAWRRVLETHDALRSIVVWGDLPHPVQVVYKGAPLPFDVIDARELEQAERAATYRALRGRCQASTAPWIDVQLVRVSDEGYLQACDYHMSLVDGFALRELRIDLFTEYANVLASRPKTVAPRAPVSGFVDWLHAQDIEPAKRYWQRHGAGVTVASPVDRPRAGDYQCDYPAEAEAIIAAHARELQVPSALVMLGAWGLCYGRHCGKDDLVVALMDSGRNAPVDGITEMVGSFSHRLPLRLDMSNKSESLRAWLRGIQLQIADMQAHEHLLSRERLQAWWGVDAGHLPFDIGMNLQHMQPIEKKLVTEIPPTISWFFTNHPRWPAAPINLSVWFSGIGMNFVVAYDALRFSPPQVESLVEQFLQTVEAIVDDADDTLQDVIDKIDDFEP